MPGAGSKLPVHPDMFHIIPMFFSPLDYHTAPIPVCFTIWFVYIHLVLCGIFLSLDLNLDEYRH